MLEYLLFDLDGTLTDSSEGITKSVQYGLQCVGIEVTDLNELLRFIGPPLDYSFREFYNLSEEQIKKATEKYRERYNTIGKFENALYPGMAILLKDMKKRGKHLAVASSKPEVFVRQILKHFNIEQYFEVVVGSGLDGSLGTKGEVVKEALRQLFTKEEGERFVLNNTVCEKTAMIGDRRFDVEGGKENGLITIGVEYGFPEPGELKAAKADYIVRSVDELHELLLRGSDDADERRMKDYNKLQKKKRRLAEVQSRQAKRQIKVGRSSFRKSLDILFPMLIYFLVYDVAGMILSIAASHIGMKIGGSFYESMRANPETVNGILVIVTLMITMLALLPISEWEFFFNNKIVRKEEKKPLMVNIRTAIVFVIMTISASLGMNMLFELLHITELSAKYGAVAQAQSAVSVGVGVLLYGIVSPLAEETLFRGLLYNRMKQYFPKGWAMVMSALFFGLYHGNLVQGLFGFILGMVMVWLYEMYGKWYVPVLFHGIVNISSWALAFLPMEKESIFTPINCVIFMIIWILGMFYFRKMQKK